LLILVSPDGLLLEDPDQSGFLPCFRKGGLLGSGVRRDPALGNDPSASTSGRNETDPSVPDGNGSCLTNGAFWHGASLLCYRQYSASFTACGQPVSAAKWTDSAAIHAIYTSPTRKGHNRAGRWPSLLPFRHTTRSNEAR